LDTTQLATVIFFDPVMQMHSNCLYSFSCCGMNADACVAVLEKFNALEFITE